MSDPTRVAPLIGAKTTSNFTRTSATSHRCKVRTSTLYESWGVLMLTPRARIASTRADHCSMSTPSSPAEGKSAPRDASLAPAPYTATFLRDTSPSLITSAPSPVICSPAPHY